MSYTDNSLVARLKQAWSAFCCQGDPIFAGQVSLTTLKRQSARCGDIDAADSPASLGWKCVKRFENCEACPRFNAYWQGLAAGRSMAGNIHPLPGFEQDESDVGDGDGKAAEIEHINEHQVGAVSILSAGHVHPNPDPVLAPASPSIEETKGRPKQGNSERYRLDEILIHGAPKHSSGHALIWPVVIVVALAAAASQLDGPSELQAAQDVADEAAYATAQADGGASKCAALGRTAIWTADGDLICRLPKTAKPMTVAQGG